MTHKPVDRWLKALKTPNESDALAILEEVYNEYRPRNAEMTFTPACEFTCRHCIYTTGYGKNNQPVKGEVLGDALVGLTDSGIDTFIYAGRMVTEEGVKAIRKVRVAMPTARIGMIDTGISVRSHLDKVTEVDLDWIDISLDGMPEDHDRQRERVGSFNQAVEGLSVIMEQRLAKRISVLTCPTVLNAGSIPEMMVKMNHLGVRNFFISPVVEKPELSLSDEGLIAFIRNILDLMERLEDTLIGISLYKTEHFALLANAFGADKFRPDGESVVWETVSESGNSEVKIRHFPKSLAGTNELIISPNGEVVAPSSMIHPETPEELVFGNIIREEYGTIWKRIAGEQGQRIYGQELRKEREILKQCA